MILLCTIMYFFFFLFFFGQIDTHNTTAGVCYCNKIRPETQSSTNCWIYRSYRDTRSVLKQYIYYVCIMYVLSYSIRIYELVLLGRVCLYFYMGPMLLKFVGISDNYSTLVSAHKYVCVFPYNTYDMFVTFRTVISSGAIKLRPQTLVKTRFAYCIWYK